MIKNLMHEGKLVPSDIIVRLLLTAMLQSGNDRFLVDGFPRNEENRRAYESIVSSDRRRVCRLPQLFFSVGRRSPPCVLFKLLSCLLAC